MPTGERTLPASANGFQQLQAQFAIHVHDKNWGEALRIGKQITDEFPNTRMAAEVREKLSVLQERAQQPLAV